MPTAGFSRTMKVGKSVTRRYKNALSKLAEVQYGAPWRTWPLAPATNLDGWIRLYLWIKA